MASKDQAIGWAIFLVCIVIAIVYFFALVFADNVIQWLGWNLETATLQLWLVAIPVLITFLIILGIGSWIGWTMATTPPPKPIEEIHLEETKEEEKESLGTFGTQKPTKTN